MNSCNSLDLCDSCSFYPGGSSHERKTKTSPGPSSGMDHQIVSASMIFLLASNSCACFAASALSISNSSCSVMPVFLTFFTVTIIPFFKLFSYGNKRFQRLKSAEFSGVSATFQCIITMIRNKCFCGRFLPDDGLFSALFPAPEEAILPVGK